MASTAAAEDCGSGGGVAVKHGMVGKGPVVGMVQVSSIQNPGLTCRRASGRSGASARVWLPSR